MSSPNEVAVDEREARRLAREERRETAFKLKRKADADADADTDTEATTASPSPRDAKTSKTSEIDDATTAISSSPTVLLDDDAGAMAGLSKAPGSGLEGDGGALRSVALIGLRYETASLGCELGTPSRPMSDESYVKLSTALLTGHLGKFQTREQMIDALRGCFLSAAQARLLCLATTSKLTYVMPDKDSAVFKDLNDCCDVVHTILARVVDKDNLKDRWGAEGYYAGWTDRENPTYWRPFHS